LTNDSKSDMLIKYLFILILGQIYSCCSHRDQFGDPLKLFLIKGYPSWDSSKCKLFATEASSFGFIGFCDSLSELHMIYMCLANNFLEFHPYYILLSMNNLGSLRMMSLFTTESHFQGWINWRIIM